MGYNGGMIETLVLRDLTRTVPAAGAGGAADAEAHGPLRAPVGPRRVRDLLRRDPYAPGREDTRGPTLREGAGGRYSGWQQAGLPPHLRVLVRQPGADAGLPWVAGRP